MVRFERQEKFSRYLDPRGELEEVRVRIEVRRDPLTGRTGRVAHFVGLRLQPLDFREVVEATRAGCPFCPERLERAATRFPPDIVPEGRLRRGEAVLFPNLSPYDEHSAVVVITAAHHVPLGGFEPGALREALALCSEYFRRIRHLPRTPYALVNWNYMPAAGASQIHPHLQVLATDTPGNTHAEELAASERYLQTEGRPYWADLVEAEEKLGERFIARGRHTVWLTAFVSYSPLSDVLVIFPGRRSWLELPEEALDEFAGGLVRVLRALESQGVYSFNLGSFPGTEDRDDVWLHVRLSPRLYVTPHLRGTDVAALQMLYREPFMVRTPEEVAATLRESVLL